MQVVQQDQRSAAEPSVQTSPVWIGWMLAAFGLGIGMAAGAASVRAWPLHDWTQVTMGALMAACGVLAMVAGLQRVHHAGRVASFYREPITGQGQALPRLGELLVYKYQLISEKDLQRALDRQKETANRPIGEILVDMGRLNWRDLTRALEDQLGYGDPWKRS